MAKAQPKDVKDVKDTTQDEVKDEGKPEPAAPTDQDQSKAGDTPGQQPTQVVGKFAWLEDYVLDVDLAAAATALARVRRELPAPVYNDNNRRAAAISLLVDEGGLPRLSAHLVVALTEALEDFRATR